MEILMLVCGVILGSLLTIIVISRMSVGTLYIVKSHLEDDPQLLCELYRPIQTVAKKRFVCMTVDCITTRD
jgi:hypothetical protein